MSGEASVSLEGKCEIETDNIVITWLTMTVIGLFYDNCHDNITALIIIIGGYPIGRAASRRAERKKQRLLPPHCVPAAVCPLPAKVLTLSFSANNPSRPPPTGQHHFSPSALLSSPILCLSAVSPLSCAMNIDNSPQTSLEGHSHGHSHSHSHSESHSHSHSNSNSHSHSHSHSGSDSDSHPHSRSHANPNSNSNSNSHTNGHLHLDPAPRITNGYAFPSPLLGTPAPASTYLAPAAFSEPHAPGLAANGHSHSRYIQSHPNLLATGY